jgi:cysteinyl-tRNA synthetase
MIRLFNTYSRSLEEFSPLDPAGREVKMYTCGPTVYSHAHIGNLRAYVFEDLLQRHLELRGFTVRRVMNITDVDDKTIRGSREAGVPLAEFTAPFKKGFFDDLDALRIKRADSFPEATDPRELAKMIEMIGTLMERGLAYQAEDKSLYFRINKFPDYGKLAHFDLEELRSTGRVKNDEYDKENIGDFALWKAWDDEDGDVKWESPWGPGRPGWHIECSAMATQLLGEQLDIHCGGVDNIFPHHEAEIAQTEGCTGKKFVRYWLHCAHLMVEGQKMAKSLGNFHTLRDLLAKGYKDREIRYALLRVHYRKPLNFTWAGMEEARESLARVDEWVSALTQLARPSDFGATGLTKFGDLFFEALDNDLDISGALGHLFDLIRESNRAMKDRALDENSAYQVLEKWREISKILAIEKSTDVKVLGGEAHGATGTTFILTSNDEISPEIATLAFEREQARLAKDWRKSDELRDELAARGWEARDTKDGQKIRRRGGA